MQEEARTPAPVPAAAPAARPPSSPQQTAAAAAAASGSAASDAAQPARGLRGLMRGLTGRSRSSASPQAQNPGTAEALPWSATSTGASGSPAATADASSGAAGGFSAAAVVRALLHSADADMGAGEGVTGSPRVSRPGQQQQGIQARGAGSATPASTPSALASILVAAPQVGAGAAALCLCCSVFASLSLCFLACFLASGRVGEG